MADHLGTLERDLDKGGVKPIYLVQGEERLLVDEAVRVILRRAVGDPDDRMAVTRVDLAESGVGARDVLGACRSLGLFATKIAVLVRAAEHLDKREADREELARYAEKPSPDVTLVLVATKLNGTTALFKRVKKYGQVLTFDALKPRDVPGWVVAEAERLGHRIDIPTARLVGDLVGTHLQQLRLAVDQVSLYVGPKQPLTEHAVETCLAATRVHTVFELVDAVGEGRLPQALSHLHAMLEHREQPLKILAMLIRHFRTLWQVAASRAQGQGLDELTGALKLHPFQARKLWNQCHQFDARALRRAYERLFEADLRLKSAGLDDAIVLERLVMDLCR